MDQISKEKEEIFKANLQLEELL